MRIGGRIFKPMELRQNHAAGSTSHVIVSA
jgi:hypothetical protein